MVPCSRAYIALTTFCESVQNPMRNSVAMGATDSTATTNAQSSARLTVCRPGQWPVAKTRKVSVWHVASEYSLMTTDYADREEYGSLGPIRVGMWSVSPDAWTGVQVPHLAHVSEAEKSHIKMMLQIINCLCKLIATCLKSWTCEILV